MSNRKKGLLLALLSAILYALSPVIAKSFVNIFSPLFVAFVVVLISDCYLLAIVICRREFLENIKRQRIKWIIILGLLAASGSLFSFFGLSKGKANAAGFFFQFETLFAAVLAFVILREKLTRSQILGLITMLLGAYFFSTGFSTVFDKWNALFLGAAFFWGVNDIIAKRKVSDISPFFLAAGRSFFSSIFLFPFAFTFFSSNIAKIKMVHVFSFLLYGGVLAGLILCLYSAFRYIKTAEATAFQLLIPILTASVAYIILGEQLTVYQLIGGAVILIGLFLIIQKK